jgi:hypothetical protein
MAIFNAAMAQDLLPYYATQQEMFDYFAIPLGNLVVFPDPGPEPAVNPIPPHAAWVENRKVFLDIQTRLRNFDSKLWNPVSMSEAALEPLRNDHGAIFFNTPLQRMALFTAAHGALTGADIDALDNTLKEPFIQGEDFVAFILRRAATLRSLAIAGAPMNVRQQVASLKLAVTPCGHFQDVLTKYLADFPLPVNQLHADLVTRLRQYAENARPVATTGSAGFASAAVAAPSDVTALQQQLQAIQIQLAAQNEQFAFLVPRERGASKGSVQSSQPLPPKNALNGKTLTPGYCWTHGECYHTSVSCKRRAPGHQAKATRDRKAGGR